MHTFWVVSVFVIFSTCAEATKCGIVEPRTDVTYRLDVPTNTTVLFRSVKNDQYYYVLTLHSNRPIAWTAVGMGKHRLQFPLMNKQHLSEGIRAQRSSVDPLAITFFLPHKTFQNLLAGLPCIHPASMSMSVQIAFVDASLQPHQFHTNPYKCIPCLSAQPATYGRFFTQYVEP